MPEDNRPGKLSCAGGPAYSGSGGPTIDALRTTRLGATFEPDNRCRFRVWAPAAQKVELRLLNPAERHIPMESCREGYHEVFLEGVEQGARYFYLLDGGQERPDPASRFQPEGVHGPSEVVDTRRFEWSDREWTGLPLRDYILYELHVGTFTPEGTFDAVILHLDRLKELGVTAIELMPVAQFPGSRNWGYDGVNLFAVQNSYGGPAGLQRLVDACHCRGLAVALDVVYNHFGPEGNYLADFGPYFTSAYSTPWGPALNFSESGSDEVRRFFVENGLYWLAEFHFDALRLDAVHAIIDPTPAPFLEELGEAFHKEAGRLGRRAYLIAESAANDSRLVRSREKGGYGLDAVWNDDFHHALHTLLTGESNGYYQDYGELHHLAKAFREGFVCTGQHSAYLDRRHGSSSADLASDKFVVFAQNHDQVGNRAHGDRLCSKLTLEELKLAAAAVLLSPFIPLLFMGEEYGDPAPFQYFVSHTDPKLIEAVREGRESEFEDFGWQGDAPDPQSEVTFRDSTLNPGLRTEGRHAALLDFYQELLRLRKQLPALSRLSKGDLEVTELSKENALAVRRWNGNEQALLVLHFGGETASLPVPLPAGNWKKLLDSTGGRWAGNGADHPDTIYSEGEVTLPVKPRVVLLYALGNPLS